MYSKIRFLYHNFVALYSLFYAYYLKLIGVEVGTRFVIYGIPHIFSRKRGAIKIGNKLTLNSTQRSNPIGLNHCCIIRTLTSNATITIGNRVGMSGATLLAREKITIGSNVLLGANCTITDSEHHSLNVVDRVSGDSSSILTSPVYIADNVWLGMNVIVLKGVSIGENTIVGAGSIVVKSLPANVIAAGNPAKIIKKISEGGQ